MMANDISNLLCRFIPDGCVGGAQFVKENMNQSKVKKSITRSKRRVLLYSGVAFVTDYILAFTKSLLRECTSRQSSPSSPYRHTTPNTMVRAAHPSNRPKIRVGRGHIFLATVALIILFLFTTARMLSVHHHQSDADVAVGSLGLRLGVTDNAPQNSFHFIVSSDCTSYQRWETLVQFHSAQSIKQCGRFTWIVSGCLDDGQEHVGIGKGGANSDVLTRASLLSEVERHFPQVTVSNHTVAKDALLSNEDTNNNDCHTIHPHVHFTPDYSDMSKYPGPFADGKKKRTFVNRQGKTLGGNFGQRMDEAIVLVDPDFLFLNKFQFKEGVEPVMPGKPAAAKYGLGGQYFSAGAPYVIHIQDVLALSKRWAELVPPTYDEYPLLYAEMFAYSMAAADLNLKHNLIKGLFCGCMTGWPHSHEKEELYALKKSALKYAHTIELEAGEVEAGTSSIRGASSCFAEPLKPPPFMHYCARYSFKTPYPPEGAAETTGGTYHFFAKRRVDHDILDCTTHAIDHPLEPFVSSKPEKVEGGDKDWNVLAVCAIVRSINFAKEKGCAEVDETMTQ
ncbi:predicted protein [Thalassiosira pseudonana CCMP1335]|uniref:Uncharacterized protein n=1 Tax=Thalassiosira pseudonana TaxID=35128 RepID=B5YP45_THAPS|nr:predicted protein [Thalassiosira pseudonana CCMP1335]ACI64739.1 predicted protein [Thalassiosira pseudonana CCMP1335]